MKTLFLSLFCFYSLHSAAVVTYTLNAVDQDNNIIGKIRGNNICRNSVGEVEYVAYPRYFNKNGTIYNADKSGSGQVGLWRRAYEITVEKNTFTHIYERSSIENCVYYSEMEDIPGVTIRKIADITDNCSNGGAAYVTEAKQIVTLPAGHYTIRVGVYNHSGEEDLSINAGDEEIWATHTDGEELQETEASFTLTHDTPIIYKNGGSKECLTDYIMIYGEAEENDDILGWNKLYSSDEHQHRTDFYTLDVGESMTLHFQLHGNNGMYDNFMLELYDADDFIGTLEAIMKINDRPHTYQHSIDFHIGEDESDLEYGQFDQDMTDAYVSLEVTYTSERKIKVEGQYKNNDHIYNAYFTGPVMTNETAQIRLTTRNSWIHMYRFAHIAVNEEARWGTFCAAGDIDIPEELRAYTCEEVSESGHLILEEIFDMIPAYTPVMLQLKDEYPRMTAISPKFLKMDNNADGIVTYGLLHGNTSSTTPTDIPYNSRTYLLQIQNHKIGFYRIAHEGYNVGYNRCYLELPEENEARISFHLDEAENATDIHLTDGQTQPNKGTTADGKYIKNGKLLIIKNGQMFSPKGHAIE